MTGRTFIIISAALGAAVAAVLAYAAPEPKDAPIVPSYSAKEIKRLTGIRASLVTLGRDVTAVDRRIEALAGGAHR
jgi:hypothetical protein